MPLEPHSVAQKRGLQEQKSSPQEKLPSPLNPLLMAGKVALKEIALKRLLSLAEPLKTGEEQGLPLANLLLNPFLMA